MFSTIRLEQGIDSEIKLARHNLEMLSQCYASGQRYRVRHGLMRDGTKVAVVVKVVSFLDKVISFLPSFGSIKKRFIDVVLNAIYEDQVACTISLNIARAKKTLPFIPESQWQEAHISCTTYNQWCELPDGVSIRLMNNDGNAVREDSLIKKEQVMFYESECCILSNSYIKSGSKLCFVKFPGIVTNARCIEIHLLSERFYYNSQLKTMILNSKTVSEADKKTDGFIPDGMKDDYEDNLFSYHESDDSVMQSIEAKILLNLVRTRAQQESEFRQELIKTGDKLIVKMTLADAKWGCIKEKNRHGTYSRGSNLHGRILMQVRQEIKNDCIPEVDAEKVRRCKGFCVDMAGSKHDPAPSVNGGEPEMYDSESVVSVGDYFKKDGRVLEKKGNEESDEEFNESDKSDESDEKWGMLKGYDTQLTVIYEEGLDGNGNIVEEEGFNTNDEDELQKRRCNRRKRRRDFHDQHMFNRLVGNECQLDSDQDFLSN